MKRTKLAYASRHPDPYDGGVCCDYVHVATQWGIAVALPVITVPGEAYGGAAGQSVNFTNTIIATLLVDAAVIVFLILAWRASNGWKREVATNLGVGRTGWRVYVQPDERFCGHQTAGAEMVIPACRQHFRVLTCRKLDEAAARYRKRGRAASRSSGN